MTALLPAPVYLPELLSDSKWFLDELRNGGRLFPKTLSNLFGFLTDLSKYKHRPDERR